MRHFGRWFWGGRGGGDWPTWRFRRWGSWKGLHFFHSCLTSVFDKRFWRGRKVNGRIYKCNILYGSKITEKRERKRKKWGGLRSTSLSPHMNCKYFDLFPIYLKYKIAHIKNRFISLFIPPLLTNKQQKPKCLPFNGGSRNFFQDVF